MNIICDYDTDGVFKCKKKSSIFIFTNESDLCWKLRYEIIIFDKNNLFALCDNHWEIILARGYCSNPNVKNYRITKEKYIKYLALQ